MENHPYSIYVEKGQRMAFSLTLRHQALNNRSMRLSDTLRENGRKILPIILTDGKTIENNW